MKLITVELDTVADVCEGEDRMLIDRYGMNEEEEFLKVVTKNKVHHEVIVESGPGGWPIVEYTGTKEQLIPVLSLLSPSGYTEEELTEKLKDWDGDENDEAYIEVMF